MQPFRIQQDLALSFFIRAALMKLSQWFSFENIKYQPIVKPFKCKITSSLCEASSLHSKLTVASGYNSNNNYFIRIFIGLFFLFRLFNNLCSINKNCVPLKYTIIMKNLYYISFRTIAA